MIKVTSGRMISKIGQTSGTIFCPDSLWAREFGYRIKPEVTAKAPISRIKRR